MSLYINLCAPPPSAKAQKMYTQPSPLAKNMYSCYRQQHIFIDLYSRCNADITEVKKSIDAKYHALFDYFLEGYKIDFINAYKAHLIKQKQKKPAHGPMAAKPVKSTSPSYVYISTRLTPLPKNASCIALGNILKFSETSQLLAAKAS